LELISIFNKFCNRNNNYEASTKKGQPDCGHNSSKPHNKNKGCVSDFGLAIYMKKYV
jgi:hypothetical protein